MGPGSLIPIAAGVAAAFGAVGLFAAGVGGDAVQRARRLRVGAYGFGCGGLVLLIGAFAGWCSGDALFGGFMMLVLGTGIELAPAGRAVQTRH